MKKGRLSEPPFFNALPDRLAMTPGARVGRGAAFARWQRHPRLEPFELDAGARPGAQQPVGRLAQPEAALLSILGERGIERGEKGRDVAIDPAAQLLIDKRAVILAGGLGFARLLGRRCAFRHGEMIATVATRIERRGAARRTLERMLADALAGALRLRRARGGGARPWRRLVGVPVAVPWRVT